MSSRNFRLLIVLYGVLVTGLMLSQPLADEMLPPDIRYCLGIESRSVLDAEEPLLSTDARSLVFYVYVVALLAALAGLLAWRHWGRTLFLVCVAMNVIMIPLGEAQVTENWWSLFNYVSVLTEGALLALVYLSPLKSNYELPESAAQAA